MIIKYGVDGGSPEYGIGPGWCLDSLDYIATKAAYDYYHNHDADSESWPLCIELFHDSKSLGKFQVQLEYEPSFSAEKMESEY